MAPIAVVTLFLVATLTVSNGDPSEKYYASAIVESCGGCSLNRLPDVKKFISQDVPEYNNVEFKHIQGAVPELVLFNEHDEEVERLPLSRLSREECNDLLVSKGFTKSSKTTKDEI